MPSSLHTVWLHKRVYTQYSSEQSPITQVIVLRALQSRLLEALSKVHNGAAQLAVLKRPEKEALPVLAAAAGSEPSGEGERERLLTGARRATRKCIESILSVRPSSQSL